MNGRLLDPKPDYRGATASDYLVSVRSICPYILGSGECSIYTPFGCEKSHGETLGSYIPKVSI